MIMRDPGYCQKLFFIGPYFNIVLFPLYFVSTGILCFWLRKKYTADEEHLEIYDKDQRTIFPFHLKLLALYVLAQILTLTIGSVGATLKILHGARFINDLLTGLVFGIDNIFIGKMI